MTGARALHLLAEDSEDVAVISATLQDAVAKVGDITFEPRPRRLTIVFNRFRWEADTKQRIRSALQIGGVLEVKTRKIRRDRPDAVVELLAISFEPGQPPGGVFTLTFAGGGDLKVEVECVDAVLADLSEPWPTPRIPSHGA